MELGKCLLIKSLCLGVEAYCSIVISIEVWFSLVIAKVIIGNLKSETMNKLKSMIVGVGTMMWGLMQL